MGEPSPAADSGMQKPQMGNILEEPKQGGIPRRGQGASWETLPLPALDIGKACKLNKASPVLLKELFVSKGLMEQLTVSEVEEITQWMLKCGFVEKLSLE